MRQVFPIVPSEGNPFWIVLVVVISCAIAVAAVLYVSYSPKRVRFEIGDGALKIAGDWYGRTIPTAHLMLENARVLNLDEDIDYRFRWRTNGTALPGYRAGWFKLANGEKALAFITDRTHVAYLPTTENYSLMLSVADPQGFIGALKAGQ